MAPPVRFSAAQQAVTYVTFTTPGSYTLQVIATDSLGSITYAVGPITVNPAVALSSSQGWILSPINRATVTGMVPITLMGSETLKKWHDVRAGVSPMKRVM